MALVIVGIIISALAGLIAWMVFIMPIAVVFGMWGLLLAAIPVFVLIFVVVVVSDD